MKPGKTDGTFYNHNTSKSTAHGPVGPQGTGGRPSGQTVGAVNNPRGIEPKTIGGGRQPLMQGPVEPKVGK